MLDKPIWWEREIAQKKQRQNHEIWANVLLINENNQREMANGSERAEGSEKIEIFWHWFYAVVLKYPHPLRWHCQWFGLCGAEIANACLLSVFNVKMPLTWVHSNTIGCLTFQSTLEIFCRCFRTHAFSRSPGLVCILKSANGGRSKYDGEKSATEWGE